MAQKVVTVHKMKSQQETTSLGQIATVMAKPTISDKHYFINTDTRRFKIQTGDMGPPPPPPPSWQGLYIYNPKNYTVHLDDHASHTYQQSTSCL